MIRNLSKFLLKGDWGSANEQTRLILNDRQFLNSKAIKEIDIMWSSLSDNYYGFSVQFEIWQNFIEHHSITGTALYSSFEYLGDHIGWRQDGKWACWKDKEYWPKIPGVPSIPLKFTPTETIRGLLPFHDVVTDGDWKHNFSPRDCWGESAWHQWAHLYRLLKT